MVTIGRDVLDESVFELFEGIRTFDAERATAVLADDVDWRDPWGEAPLRNRAAVLDHLKQILDDPVTRRSWTIRGITGDSTITHMTCNTSGRFGDRPQKVKVSTLCLKGVIHQVVIQEV